MKMDEFNQQDALLDKALGNLPIAPLPPDFVNQVMATIETVDVAQSQSVNRSPSPIRFRLQFLDIVLALFWSAILAAVWLIILWWTGIMQLNWLPPIQSTFNFGEHLATLNPSLLIGGTLLFLLELSLLGLIGLNLLGERPS